jgi:RNA polymerase sigma factor (sigma-70 family)
VSPSVAPHGPTPNPTSDEELLLRYREGDTAAFRELFERFAPILLRVLRRDLSPPSLAEDLVQQTFLQLHRARFDFDPARRFKPWIFTIALNLKREHFRASRQRPTASSDDAAEVAVPPADHQRVDVRQTIAWALERIPGEQREVIELHWFEGLSFRDVAHCLGIGAVAAKVRAHRGYARLRALLDRQEPKAGNSSTRQRI